MVDRHSWLILWPHQDPAGNAGDCEANVLECSIQQFRLLVAVSTIFTPDNHSSLDNLCMVSLCILTCSQEENQYWGQQQQNQFSTVQTYTETHVLMAWFPALLYSVVKATLNFYGLRSNNLSTFILAMYCKMFWGVNNFNYNIYWFLWNMKTIKFRFTYCYHDDVCIMSIGPC